MTEPHCSNFRIITVIFQVSQYLGILWYTKTQQSVYQCKHCKDFSCSHRMYVGPSTKFCDGFMSQINNFIMMPFCQHDFFFENVFQYIYHHLLWSIQSLYMLLQHGHKWKRHLSITLFWCHAHWQISIGAWGQGCYNILLDGQITSLRFSLETGFAPLILA